MGGKFFGTDGIRGFANRAPMTAETALKVGMAAGGALVLFILWTYAKRTPRVETFEAAEKVAPQRRRSKRRA